MSSNTTTTLSSAARKYVADATLPKFGDADATALYMAFIEAKAVEMTDAKWDASAKGDDAKKMAAAHHEAKVRRVVAWNAYATKYGMPLATLTAPMAVTARKLGILS